MSDQLKPVAEVSQETFSSDGTSDIITCTLPIGTKLYAIPEGGVVVSKELLFQIAADCENDNDLCWITKELRALIGKDGEAQHG